MSENYFNDLAEIDVSKQVEKKAGLSYLSWAFAWGELKKRHPESCAQVYENSDGWNYHTDGKTCWVKVGVTVNSLQHVEYLPVMDSRNKSIPLASVTSWDVNKAIQRAMTKAIARHGLGLYIYAGEDLPDSGDAPAPSMPIEPSPAETRCKELVKQLDLTDELKAKYWHDSGKNWANLEITLKAVKAKRDETLAKATENVQVTFGEPEQPEIF